MKLHWTDIIGLALVCSFALMQAIQTIISSITDYTIVISYNAYNEGFLEVMLGVFVIFYFFRVVQIISILRNEEGQTKRNTRNEKRTY